MHEDFSSCEARILILEQSERLNLKIHPLPSVENFILMLRMRPTVLPAFKIPPAGKIKRRTKVLKKVENFILLDFASHPIPIIIIEKIGQLKKYFFYKNEHFYLLNFLLIFKF